VAFRLSLAENNVHQETCLCLCRGLASDDATSEAVQEERGRRKFRNKNAFVFLYEMFVVREVKYCLVFITIVFISVS
jgi:hypothetical protein